MTKEQIEEAVDIIDAVFGDNYVSVSNDWDERRKVNVHYAIRNYIGRNTNVSEARKKVQDFIEFLKKQNHLI